MLAASLYFALKEPARLGLDLRGGTQIVLEAQDTPQVKADRESTDRAREVLQRRINALGVAESSITRSGERRLIVELPTCRTRPAPPRSSAAPPSSPCTRSCRRPPANCRRASSGSTTRAASRSSSDRRSSPATRSAAPRPSTTRRTSAAGPSPWTSGRTATTSGRR
ncbi:hypothetical protein [Actinomadura sp. CNU-125]|uniref:hypothetical protein n=1 Tax=Actinomadura sp. CNU-125 TaxID=1904961 RepID=UPI002916051A|nr:hypothetical protein [Actinomadura sp. CNU-125]